MNIRDTKEYGVSPVVGIAVLIAIAVIFSALVFATTSGFMTEQQAPSAGANVNIVSESVIEVQLDSIQNADTVYVQSPLGTRYEFDGVGDTVEILNIGNQQKPVVIAEKDGKESVVQGITPRSFNADYVVDKEMGFSEALTAASPGDTIAVKRGTYSTNLTIDRDVKIVSEYGTKVDGDVTVDSTTMDVTISNTEVSGDVTVEGDNTYLASNTINGTLSKNSTTIVSKSNNLIQKTNDETTTTTNDPNSAPTANFTYSPSEPIVNETVSFDASDSSDSDGSIESYEWDFDGDGTVDKTGKTVETSFSSGEHVVSLKVTDDDGLSTGTNQSINPQSNEITVDNFEDGDLSEYSVTVNGATGSGDFGMTSTNGIDGSKALMYNGDRYTYALSMSGLDSYPSRGDKVSFYTYYTGNGGNVGLSFGVGSSSMDNRYMFYVRNAGYSHKGDHVQLSAVEGGTSVETNYTPFDVSEHDDKWIRWVIDWGDPTITVTGYEVSTGSQLTQISIDDASHDTGGIAFHGNSGSGTTNYYDNLLITG